MLLQEEFRYDPWKMLIACIMLNQTNNKQVRKVIYEFFDRWPDAKSVISADSKEIAECIRSLGIYNRRTKTIQKFSEDWIRDGWNLKLYGIGKYAIDSWEIFQEGKLASDTQDKVLRRWLDK